MQPKDNSLSNSIVQMEGTSNSSILDKNLEDICNESKLVKIDIRQSGKVKIKDLIQQNYLLKQKVRKLEIEIKCLKDNAQNMINLNSPTKKPNGIQQVYEQSSQIQIDYVSQLDSCESPLYLNKQKVVKVQNIKDSLKKQQNCQKIMNGQIDVFQNSNIDISIFTDSDKTKQVGLMNKHKIQESKFQQKPKIIKLAKTKTLNQFNNSIQKVPSMPDNSQSIINTQESILVQEQQSKKQPQVSKQPDEKYIGVSLARSDLTQFINYNMDNEVCSILNDDDKDSYLQQSSIYSNVFVSNKSPLKKSAFGGIRNSFKNAQINLRRTQRRNGLMETQKCEKIYEEQGEQKQEEQHEQNIRTTPFRNNELAPKIDKNQRLLRFTSKITEQNSENDSSKYDDDVMITKSLASAYIKKKSNSRFSREDSNNKNQTIVSDKSTYQNSQNTGSNGKDLCLRTSSKTQVPALSSANNGRKKQKDKKVNKNIGLYEIKQSSNMEPKQGESAVGVSLKKSKSSHLLKSTPIKDEVITKKYEQIIQKLALKMKKISLKNKQLKDIIHKLRHQFYDFNQLQTGARKKRKHSSNISEQIQANQVCADSQYKNKTPTDQYDCSYSNCHMKKMQHFIKRNQRIKDIKQDLGKNHHHKIGSLPILQSEI